MTKESAHARVSGTAALAAVALIIAALGGSRMAPDPATLASPPFFATERIAAVLEPVVAEVEAGAFPGAAIAFGAADREVYTFGIGEIGWTRNSPAVDAGVTRYDLASLTKVVATASAVMLLVEDGRLALDDAASLYLPHFDEGPKAHVTLRHLLAHRSGLPAGTVVRGASRREQIDGVAKLEIYPPAGLRQEYSDVGYVLLWEATQKAAREPLEDYLERRLFQPLGMTATSFSPGLDCEQCAPTGRLRDQSLYRGKPFDPIAQRLDGIAGNTGLFSTASDLGRFAAMIAMEAS